MTNISDQEELMHSKLSAMIRAFAETAVQRDKLGGNPKRERDLIRQSGLLGISVPSNLGGLGKGWSFIFEMVREIAKVDSSLAHVFGYHFLSLHSVYLFGTEKQSQKYLSEAVSGNLFWGNAFNPLDRGLQLERQGTDWILNGKKRFCSGSADSDRLLVSAFHDNEEFPFIAVIPTKRQGVEIYDDWDAVGQRQTDSGTVSFNNVLIKSDEQLTNAQAKHEIFPTIRTHIAQTILTYVMLGTAEGALQEAITYTKTFTRPWLTSGIEKIEDDPFILKKFGELYVDIKAASMLAEEARKSLQHAWDLNWELTEQGRGECGITIATAKAATIKMALDVTSSIFQIMGARSVAGNLRFDRYWRNVRTLSLHDPIEYKYRDLGKWALANTFPKATSYS